MRRRATPPSLVILILLQSVALPAQDRKKHPYAMDYGPFISASWRAQWPADNVALKGLSIRVAGTPPAHVIFDTELLRVAAAASDHVRALRGTPYDGAHGPTPEMGGHQVFATPVAPGWAHQKSFADPRPIPHGPLPRSHARYKGLYLHRDAAGDKVIVSYTVGACEVLEGYSVEGAGDDRLLARTLDLGKSSLPMTLAVASRAGARIEIDGRVAVLRYEVPRHVAKIDRANTSWTELDMGGPSRDDYADSSKGHGVVTTWVNGFAAPHRQAGADGGKLPRLHDGNPARNQDDPGRATWFDRGRARLLTDLQKVVAVGQIHTYSRHKGKRAAQGYTLYGSVAATAPDAKAKNPHDAGWQRIATVDTTSLGRGGMHAVRIDKDEAGLGRFRYLLWVSQRRGTFFTEFDIYDAAHRPKAKAPSGPRVTAVAMVGAPEGAAFHVASADLRLTLPARGARETIKLVFWDGPAAGLEGFKLRAAKSASPRSLLPLTRGGPSRWGPGVETKGTLGRGKGAYVVDTVTTPSNAAAKSYLRFGGFDFFSDGRAALSSWNGDVWIVSGIDAGLKNLTWKRFATGLFDPLGLKIVDDVIYTNGRDQITRLHDLNEDGEADFYECFNNDVYITKSFHEFAFDLQTDKDGNFYFSKGGPVRPGGRGFDKIVPHHGCILKVAKDGSKLEVFATGLRAPNGLGVGPNGEVTSGDNEGTWTPVCRLNWMKKGTFNGCIDTAHILPLPKTYDLPLCFLPMRVDNSCGGQTWVTTDKWGPFEGELLHLSYGKSSLFKVLREEVDGVTQGGVTRFPLKFTSSCMRGRFHPKTGQLFVCGLKGWQTNAAKLTGFNRVRFTGKLVRMPAAIRTVHDGIYLTFTCGIDRKTAEDPESYEIEIWNYVWAKTYGSPEVSTVDPNLKAKPYTKKHDQVKVAAATLQPDGRTVFLSIPDIKPVMQMQIKFDLDADDGEQIKSELITTIHRVPAR